LVTKMKAKIQEYDNTPNDPGTQGQQSGDQHWSTRQVHTHDPQTSAYPQQGRSVYPTQGSSSNYGNQGETQPASTWYSGHQTHSPGQGGYIVDPSALSPHPTTATPASAPGLNPVPPLRSSFDQPTTSDAPRASFDTSRLGLKPKRPVSLIDTNAQKSSAKGKDISVDDDIEYATSPFEDR